MPDESHAPPGSTAWALTETVLPSPGETVLPSAGGAARPANAAGAYLASLSPTSRPTMRGCAEALARLASRGQKDARSFPWGELGVAEVLAIRSRLADAVAAGTWSPATANKHLACLRGILRAAWRLGQITTDTYERCRDVPLIRGSRPPRGRAVDAEARHQLIAAASGSDAASARDAALVALLYSCGLRRAEAAGLDLEHLDAKTATLMVRGKGDKVREVPVPATAMPYLEAWLGVRGTSPGPLFCRIDRYGAIHRGARVSGEAIRQVLIRRAAKAGVAPPAPHDLRRSYAGDLLDAGADLAVVASLMGHASVATTARYYRRGARAARAAADRLVV